MQSISVSLFKRKSSGIYHAQYRDPVTGEKIRKSTGERLKHRAAKIAAAWEKKINQGHSWDSGGILWDTFCQRYECEHLEGLADKTLEKSVNVLDGFKRIVGPRQLWHVNEQTLSKYQKALRDAGRSPATIKGHLSHLRAALSWALDQKLIAFMPKFPKVRRIDSSDVMKGRPITLEEFERMIEQTKKVILKPNLSKKKETAEADWDRIPSWQHLLRGLWLSGLRLGEALELTWDDDSSIRIDLTGKRPMLRIPAANEKGNKTRLMPITPDFAEFLLQTPKARRHGFVFDPLPLLTVHSADDQFDAGRIQPNAVGKVISRIGESAGVIVRTTPATDKDGKPITKTKYASAHDLRRSFGERWAYRVQPKLLQDLMRHSKIETTMRYYVGLNAERTADMLWEQFGEKTSLGADLGADGENVNSQAKCA